MTATGFMSVHHEYDAVFSFANSWGNSTGSPGEFQFKKKKRSEDLKNLTRNWLEISCLLGSWFLKNPGKPFRIA